MKRIRRLIASTLPVAVSTASFVSISALVCSACGASSERETTDSIAQALSEPNISLFLVEPDTSVSDPNTLSVKYGIAPVPPGLPDQSVYIYEDHGSKTPVFFGFNSADYDVGIKNCWGNCNNERSRAHRGGMHTYTLAAHHLDDPALSTKSFELDVQYLPTVTRPISQSGLRYRADYGAPADFTLSWTVPPKPAYLAAGQRYVRVLKPGNVYGTVHPIVEGQSEYSTTVTFAELADGFNAYRLFYCEDPYPGTWRATCSRPMAVSYEKRAGFFQTPVRRTHSPSSTSTLAWDGAGTAFRLRTPSAGLNLKALCNATDNPGCSTILNSSDVCTTSKSFKLTGSSVPTGIHEVFLKSCTATGCAANTCTTYEDRVEVLNVPRAEYPSLSPKSWEAEFTPAVYKLYDRPSTGAPLDVTFDADGNVWGIGEYATAVAFINRSEQKLYHYQVPLKRMSTSQTHGATTFYEPVKPFNGNQKSPLGERIIDTGNTGNAKTQRTVWFTQGGDYGSPNSYSRLVAFKRDLEDLSSTPWDDRFCAIHVPGPNTTVTGGVAGESYGAAAQAYGVDWDPVNQRVWVAKFNRRVATQLAWLKPEDWVEPTATGYRWKPGACDNMLDYGVDADIQAASLKNACPSASPCLTNVSPPLCTGCTPRLHHVEVVTSRIWFTAVGEVGFLDTATSANSKAWQAPPTLRSGFHAFGAYPWQLRVSGQYAYYGEFTDLDIVRVDANASTSTPLAQLHMPIWGRDSHLHSLALDTVNNRLWFTITAEKVGQDEDDSMFGYVDLASWTNGLPVGAYYGVRWGKDWVCQGGGCGFVLKEWSTPLRGFQHSLRGMEVRAIPGTSKIEIALADGVTDEIVILTQI